MVGVAAQPPKPPPPPPPPPPPKVVVYEPDLRRGRAIFKKYCAQCHTFKPEGRGTVRGPNIFGVVGTHSGEKVKMWGGSWERLADFRLRWTEETLLAWLERPQDFVPQRPGDRSCMTFRGFDREDDRMDLTGFLAANEAH
eukprot:TRINITY_DN1932_c1_g1_i1.p1 TRINITY_DN1932_c1_g1~~TRINITY_DN1932_c1_g1_i1.p1  ORF type:complete len:140 (-),score=23.89 TRINITY_DN1932_c1_g1_i1:49-468(-)